MPQLAAHTRVPLVQVCSRDDLLQLETLILGEVPAACRLAVPFTSSIGITLTLEEMEISAIGGETRSRHPPPHPLFSSPSRTHSPKD